MPDAVSPKLLAWLEFAVHSGASDLHVVAGHPPVIRFNGDLSELPEPVVSADEIEPLLLSARPPPVRDRLSETKSADFSLACRFAAGPVRFRANVFVAAGRVGGCFRVIPDAIPDLAWAGFPDALAARLASLRDGLVILTGATGSGKTTTLAMVVQRMNAAGGFRIITVEEPVEYLFPRAANSVVTQREVGADVLTFADGLRSGLRQDPDVILIGEIRDLETAENAIQASLTGHLVFSTLHTNDAASAYTRLVDMGVEPFLVASTVEAVMAQRLVRRLCPKCKQPIRPTAEELPVDFPIQEIPAEGLFGPVGCRACRQIGFSGRMGIYELMVSSEDVRQLAQDRASSWKVKQAAVRHGMRTLRQDGWDKVLKGSTTAEEIMRVTKGDRDVSMTSSPATT